MSHPYKILTILIVILQITKQHTVDLPIDNLSISSWTTAEIAEKHQAEELLRQPKFVQFLEEYNEHIRNVEENRQSDVTETTETPNETTTETTTTEAAATTTTTATTEAATTTTTKRTTTEKRRRRPTRNGFQRKFSPKPTEKSISNPEETEKPKYGYDPGVFKKQAESAKYEFSSNINDQINGNLHQREEKRDGVKVTGKYSYSDGFSIRTVHYVADDKGYRIIQQTVEPLAKTSEYNPDGKAEISSFIAGKTINYQITEDDLIKKRKKQVTGRKHILRKNEEKTNMQNEGEEEKDEIMIKME